MSRYKCLYKLFALIAISTGLTGCFSLRHSGYGIKMQASNGWQQEESKWKEYTFISTFGYCNGNKVKPNPPHIEYLTWIGPPYLPIFPVTRPHKFYSSFDLFYQHFKVKSIDNCPIISINKGVLIKAYSFSTEDTCYYWPEIPPTDFTMSFEGGLDGCKLDDLNFKVTPFNSVDWFWTFKG